MKSERSIGKVVQEWGNKHKIARALMLSALIFLPQIVGCAVLPTPGIDTNSGTASKAPAYEQKEAGFPAPIAV